MSCNGACGPLSKTEGTYRGRVADNSAVVSDRERGLTEVSCNGACGPLTKTEGTYRGRVADNSADVSEKEDLLRCPAMAPVGRLKAPTGGELLTIQQWSGTY